jgi:hypothetical protein
MTVDLTTTNILLGIMAFVSLLQGLAVVSSILAGFTVYRRITQMLARIEERHVARAASKVNEILDDVKGVTSTVKSRTDQLEGLAGWVLGFIGRR